MIVFKFCMKTQNKPPINRFSAIALLRSQSDSTAQFLILLAKSSKGCREAEWIINPWLAKMLFSMKQRL